MLGHLVTIFCYLIYRLSKKKKQAEETSIGKGVLHLCVSFVGPHLVLRAGL
jgi:hypothetical protein